MPTWDVTVQFDGPESATDNAAVRFSGTDGIVAQDSGLIINDCSSATFSSTGLAVGGLAVSGLVTTTSDTDGEFVALKLINESDSACPLGFVSLEFDLEDTAGTAVDAGKIAVKKEASFTSTAASQDSMMSFQVSQNGTMTERMTISSAGNVVIGGDLTVSGATTTISSTVTTIADALTIYSFGTTGCSPSNDSGFIVERGGLANVGVIWDESADEIAFIGSTCEDGTTTGNITITAYADIHALGAEIDGVLNVDGSIAFDGTTAALNGTGAITLTSTSASACGIYLQTNGGASETLKIHANQGTGAASIDILSDDGGITLNAADGKAITLNGATVFNEVDTITYNATDTVVDTTKGNKFKITFGAGNIQDLYLHPPAGPANIMLSLIQDASGGSREVTNWYKNGGSVGSPSGTDKVHFAGGTKPTLTTAVNSVDVFALYYDGTNWHGTSILDSKAYS
jgi:hypothetical protein